MQSRTVDYLASIAADWCWRTDPQLRLTSLTGRYAELTGRETAEGLGRPWPGLDGHEDAEVTRVLLGRRPFRDLVRSHRHPDGSTRWFRLGGAPIFSRTGTFRGFRGLCSEVTAEYQGELVRSAHAQHLESTLLTQGQRFDSALAHMSHGLYMLDADLRITLVNRRFLELYGLSPEVVKVGATAEDVIRHSASVASFVGLTSDEAWAAARERLTRNDVRHNEQTLADGRIISRTYTRTPDGGCVVVHEDVTARKFVEASLAEQHRRLDIALAHMPHGLVLFDADHRVTVFNEQFLVLYGLPREAVRAGITAEDLIRIRTAAGNFPGMTAEQVWRQVSPRISSGIPYRLDQQLANGLTIAVSYAPVPGGGFVTVHEDITASTRAEAHIAHMARHDALTGLPNRIVLNEHLDAALRDEAGSTVILSLDLDRFKTVNDTLGHACGDALLCQVTGRLKAVVGSEPGDRSTLTARLGGDEFVIVLSDTPAAQAALIAQAIIATVGRDYIVDGQRVDVGASVGIAMAPGDGREPERLLNAADTALYCAKHEGRGTYRFFASEMDAAARMRRTLERDLRCAIMAGEFELHYQPFLALEADRIAGFEALVRWRHPVHGLVTPNEFIPLAEKTGLIVPLGEWVLREACREAARWPAHLRVAVNLSPVQFRNGALALTVVAALGETRLNPHRLELEITEGVLLQQGEATLSSLRQLKALGISIAIDDFGTGYASLSNLRVFPLNRIKIDRSFIADLSADPRAATIVRSAITLAASLGMTVTAEGIETFEQLAWLRQEGCTEVQGYLIGRPQSAGELLPFLADGTLRYSSAQVSPRRFNATLVSRAGAV